MTDPGFGYAETKVTTRDGVRLAVREYGSRTSAVHTIVLLHGLCLNQESWNMQVHRLIREWGTAVRIVTYDHRGHGGSSIAPMDTYRLDELANDLAEVLEALRVTGPLTLAGHSMGGMVALTYLSHARELRPVEPQRLVLVATAAGKLAQHGIGRLLAAPATRLLCQLVRHTPLGAVEHVRRLCATLAGAHGYGNADRSKLAVLAASAIDSAPLTTAAGFLSSLRHYDVSGALGAIDADTTVISGGADVLTPVWHAREIVAGITGAHHIHHPLAGHMLLVELPDVVAAAIGRGIGQICPQLSRTPA